MPYLQDFIDGVTPDEYESAGLYMRALRAGNGTDVGSVPYSGAELEAMAEYIRTLRRGVAYKVAPPTADSIKQALNDALHTAIQEPQSAETDGVKINNRSIPDLIEADKYMRSLRSSGMSFKRIIPGGSVRL